MEYTKGSEWRRWDLHIHTPGTKKNNQFKGSTIDEQWNNFYNDIISYIECDDETKKVSVLGITDYFSIDNYRKIMSDDILPKKFDLILPNIEMRVVPVSRKSALNVHLLCNPSIVSQLDSKLFSQLTFSYKDNIFHPIKEDFIKLGRLFNSNLDDNAAYNEGIQQYVIDLTELKNILNRDKELRENVVIAVSNSSNDGASGIGNPSRESANSNLTAMRDAIYYFSDVIFSSNEGDIKYFLGEKEGHNKQEIIEKYGRLKPCIHGCDAHSNDKILKPDNDCFCWIKADCTFEGLKQIIYEPKERVQISSSSPNKKRNYNVIEKVIINDDRFSTKPIMFNPNLTCFIGGRSTGKSIVLNNMVKQIDNEQYKQKFKGNEFIISNLKVYWKDGFVSDGSSNKRHIVYIPQTYLNRLSDNQEEKNEIDNIIQDVILQDSEIKQAYNDFNKNLDNIKVELDKEIYDLIKSNENLKLLSSQLNENGNVFTISNEIKKLQKQREKLTQLLKISEEEVAKYDLLKTQSKEVSLKMDALNRDKKMLQNSNIEIKAPNELNELSESLYTRCLTFLEEKEKELQDTWFKYVKEEVSKLDKEISLYNKKQKELFEQIKEKDIILEKTETLKQLNSDIEIEETKLKYGEQLEKDIKKESDNFNKLLKCILNKLSQFDSIHQKYVSLVNSKTSDFDNSMKFIATAPFRLEKFDEKVKSLFNNKKLKGIYKFYDDGIASDVDEELLSSLISPLFMPDGISYLKSGNTIEEALRSILSNWYNIVYTVELDNDKIQTMSPGKKALVLLKLLISLADAECPILIDQPEDDLDNRSIYDELVGFIRNKKNTRQIILVTHNANIVLGADAEEIIIANQEGTNSPNDNFRFEYRSGSIENNNILTDENGNHKKGILNNKGIQGHICEILEGGKEAFNIRKDKYTLV